MLCFILYKQGHFLDALFNILFSNCIFISRYKWFCIFELELVWKLREDSTPLIKHTLSSVMQLSFLSCFLQNNFQALCNKCAQCRWLEHLVTLCAIYKNLKPHLSWPSVKGITEREWKQLWQGCNGKQQRSRAILTLQNKHIIDDVEAQSFKASYL